MLKFIRKMVCMTLVTALCAVNLNAQNSTQEHVASDAANFTELQPEIPSGKPIPPEYRNSTEKQITAISPFLLQKGSKAHVYNDDLPPRGYVSFDVSTPTDMTLISSLRDIQAGEYYDGYLYAYKFYWNSGTEDYDYTFLIVESATGAVIQEIPGMIFMSDIAYDHSTNTMYGTANSILYTIDLITGIPTQVATLTGLDRHLFTLAVDLDGNMYGIQFASMIAHGDAKLVSVDKETGACTIIGNTGKRCNYAQSMNFDHYDGTLYWCQCSSTSDLNFMTVDVETGAATQIASTGCEMMAFHIPYNNEKPCPAVADLEVVQFKGTCAKLTWTEPSETDDLTGYKIHDGSTLLATLPVEQTSFITESLSLGDHALSVEAVFDADCISMGVTKVITITTCGSAIEEVDVQYDNDCKATIGWDAVEQNPPVNPGDPLFDNGGFVTHPGQGYGGANASDAKVKPDVQTYGGLANNAVNWSLADDFFLLAPSTVETIDFFVYQANSGTTSTITGVYVQIWDNIPGESGSTVIWGDLTTNCMASTLFSNIYRVNTGEVDVTDNTRPIMKVTADIGKEFDPGFYWIQVAFTGSLTSGPYANPVAVMGEYPNGNALQYDNGAWTTWADGPSRKNLALPFVIYGESGDPAPPRYNVYKDNELIISDIEETSHTTEMTVEEGVDIVWSVTQTCPVIGGESLQGFKTAKCTGSSCNPVTGASAAIESDCKFAIITWTAIPGATGFKIFMDGVELVTVGPSSSSYGMIFDFEHRTYTWDIVAVCYEGESEKVSVSATCSQGINEPASNVTIFPNPAAGSVTINAKDFVKVEIYNTVGQLMGTKTVETVDVASYNTGIYFFKIYDANNDTVTKRVMVAR